MVEILGMKLLIVNDIVRACAHLATIELEALDQGLDAIALALEPLDQDAQK